MCNMNFIIYMHTYIYIMIKLIIIFKVDTQGSGEMAQ